jgi:8-oxo-dGTP diphosphatase
VSITAGSAAQTIQIVTGIVRRGDDVLMVLQAGPGEEPYWTVPGGVSEPGELMTDALVRELREETGLKVLDPGTLAFTAQVDDQKIGYFATVWTWDVARWEGDIAVDDPDDLILEAAWVPLAEACRRLDLIGWQPLTARYLRGDLEPRSVWLRRVHPDGREEWSSRM